MRGRQTIIVCLLAAGLLAMTVSCRKENLDGAHQQLDSAAVFSASIDGTVWKTDSVSAFLSRDLPTGKAKMMTITGYSSNRVISINLRDTSSGTDDSTLTAQTYSSSSATAPIPWGNTASFGYGYGMIVYGPAVYWQQQGVASDGQAVVTASDPLEKRISGTFSFVSKVLVVDPVNGVVKDTTVSVKEGVFGHVHYTYFKHP